MIRAGIRRALSLYRRDRWQREVEDEIKLHLTLRAEQLAAEGMSPKDAYDEAVRRFGPLDEARARLLSSARQREQSMRRTEYLDDLRQDILFALRSLGRQRVWTAVTVLTLALGIAATTAVFSVVSTMLLHIYPYPNADRIVVVNQQPSTGNNTGISVTITPSVPVIRAWREQARSFEAIEPARISPRALKTVTGDLSVVMTAQVLPTFPTFAGVTPLVGRMFTDADLKERTRVAVLGESFWRERLGSDQAALGKRITIGDSMYTVIGVMPSTLRFGSAGGRPTDVWLPFDLEEQNGGGNVIARLREGATIEGATRELDSVFARASGFTGTTKLPFRTIVQRPAERVDFRDSLLLLTGAVGLLLLVSCTNVAHLLIARSATRQRELAIRTALGAGSMRLFRQLLTESALLTAVSTVLGISAGWVVLKGLIAMRPAAQDQLKAAHLDGTAVLVAVTAAIVSGLAFGLIGMLQSSGHASHDVLKSGGAAAGSGRRHRRVRSVLVVSEMALSAMLVVGAGLAVRSFQRLQSADLGFDTKGLYNLYFSYGPGLSDSTARIAALRTLETRVRALPAVQQLTMAEVGPGGRQFSIGRLEIDGEPAIPSASTSFIDVNRVQPAYFKTLGMRFAEGQSFTDTLASTVIINEGFARKHWPAGNAIGQRIRVTQGGGEPWMTIVGVVHDAKTSGPAAESTAPSLYLPPSISANRTLIVRVPAGGNALKPVRAMARELGIREVTVDGVEAGMARRLSGPRFVSLILTGFGAMALLLATIGLYGVMAYTVMQETRETGIRIALGASRGRIMRAVLTRGFALAGIGAVLGLGGAVWGSKLIEAQLFGVSRMDPVSFIAAAAVLLLAALLACAAPTRRALSVDPMTAIRAD